MIPKEQLKRLYEGQKLSMAEIATRLRTTQAIVLYWMKKYRIPRRTWSDSAYVKLNRNGDPFRIPAVFTQRQRELLRAGLMLYWAEGNKSNGALRIANLDVRLLQLFAKFLREVCHVKEHRLSVYVRVHRQFAISRAQKFWSRTLQLPPVQVHVYPHTDERSKDGQQRSPHGIATLEFHNTRLKRWLDEEIERYIIQQLPRPSQ